MTLRSRNWPDLDPMLRFSAWNQTWHTRIPAVPGWSVRLILHRFQMEDGKLDRWSADDRRPTMTKLFAHPINGPRYPPTDGELDADQTAPLLRLLVTPSIAVSLAFWTGQMVTPSSPLTSAARDENGVIQGTADGIRSLGHDDYLVVPFTGTSDALVRSLGVTRIGSDWPNLMWANDQSWMLYTHADFPFTVFAGNAALAGRLEEEPRFDLLTPTIHS